MLDESGAMSVREEREDIIDIGTVGVMNDPVSYTHTQMGHTVSVSHSS